MRHSLQPRDGNVGVRASFFSVPDDGVGVVRLSNCRMYFFNDESAKQVFSVAVASIANEYSFTQPFCLQNFKTLFFMKRKKVYVALLLPVLLSLLELGLLFKIKMTTTTIKPIKKTAPATDPPIMAILFSLELPESCDSSPVVDGDPLAPL